jgi:acylglycerol lipase
MASKADVEAVGHAYGEGDGMRYRRIWRSPSAARVARLFVFHGTHEHGGRYHEFLSLCAARGFECFTVDFRGHGRSAGERGDVGSLDGAVSDAVKLVVDESTDGLPRVLLGHSLGSLICFLTAHRLATDPSLPTPDMVVLSGFAMDSVSPPFGVKQLVPVLRRLPSSVRAITALLATLQPQGLACPLPPPSELTHCADSNAAVLRDPLHHHGWIQNRTALALLDGRARCKALLGEWGAQFAFLLVHGGDDELCPVSADEALMAASPQADKELAVFPGLYHEILFERRAERESVQRHILEWLVARVGGASDARLHRLRSRL